MQKMNYGSERFGDDSLVPLNGDVLTSCDSRVILSLDRWSGSFSGRPSGLHDEECVISFTCLLRGFHGDFFSQL